MNDIKQYLFRDMVLVDSRVLLFIVPTSMLLMRAIINQNPESVIELVAIGVLSYLWLTTRQKNFFNESFTKDCHEHNS